MQLLEKLEPRFEQAGTILFEELEEFNEVLLFEKGKVDVGYTLNRRKIFRMRLSFEFILGAYGCTFYKRAIFIYKANTDCKGYFIRKINWLRLMTEIDNGEFS